MKTRLMFAALLTLAFGLGLPAHKAAAAAAEVDDFKVAMQYGIGYLPLAIMKQNQLVEKHLKAAGLNSKVTWSRLASGQPMNDALLSGSLHVASGGVAPFLILWGRTHGNLNVKAVAALSSMPMYLVTNNPNVKTIKDFTDKDRISMAGAGQSIQTLVLQMAAAREFGDANYNKFSTLYRNLSHPDGLAAFLSGKEITAYFSSPPFQYQALAKPGVHRVINSYDITGGPATFLVAWATGKFRDENPRTFQAFVNAWKEAVDYINADKRRAAEIYVKESNDKSGVDAITKMLNDPEIRITMTPENTMKFYEFMNKVGTVKPKAASWKDLYFPEIHHLPGS
jgi:NitT/TauT family transport system substrate-binding protein